MFKNEVLFGTVTECSADNELTVELENGQIGFVTKNEISRRSSLNDAACRRMVGRRFGFFADDFDNKGRIALSAKAYEEHNYINIVEAFKSGERNVYPGHLISVTADGKLAFYSIAQGVTVPVNITDFALTRIASFKDIIMPKDIAFAIKSIDNNGRLSGYAKIAFGDFVSNCKKLQIKEGITLEGLVTGSVPLNGDSVISLAPNLTVLAQPASIGSHVLVCITKVKEEEHRLKAEIVENLGLAGEGLNYADWTVDPADLPNYMDLHSFEMSIGPAKKERTTSQPIQNDVEISYEINSDTSPFAIRECEVAIREPLNGTSADKILFEVQHGYLNDKHMIVAKAINELKITTSYQVQRYLHLKHNIKLQTSSLQTILNRLIKLDIVNVIHFSSNGVKARTNVLIPNMTQIHTYTGTNCTLPLWFYTTEVNVSWMKCCMSANQLLIGLMHEGIKVKEFVPRMQLRNEKGLRINPRWKLETDEETNIYLEAAKHDSYSKMLEKLQRYDQYFKEHDECSSKVYVTLENVEDIASFVRDVAAAHLSFEVGITSDLQCLPTPDMCFIPASSSNSNSLFSKIKAIISSRKTA